MQEQATIDMNQARFDFDGDWECVCEILKEAELDLSGRFIQLEECSLGNKADYVAVVHEIVNTLGTAWCTDVAQDMRRLELTLRQGSAPLSEDVHNYFLTRSASGLEAIRVARTNLEVSIRQNATH